VATYKTITQIFNRVVTFQGVMAIDNNTTLCCDEAQRSLLLGTYITSYTATMKPEESNLYKV
jgi:hypothetical protein